MKINLYTNKNNTPSFGWNIKTHKYLTKCAIDELGELQKYRNYIEIGSQVPDISLHQTSLIGDMAHSFFGKNFATCSICPQNASDFYFDKLGKAIEQINGGSKRAGMYYAGNALHFLQDTAVPLHTIPECDSIFRLPHHVMYENIAKNNPEIIDAAAANTKNLSEDKFYQVFIDTYKKSSQMDNPYKIARSEWKTSVNQSLNNAYASTFKFLKRLADYVKATPEQREAYFYDDAKNFLEIAEKIRQKSF